MPPDKQGHITDLFLPMLLLGERRENILDLFVFVRSFVTEIPIIYWFLYDWDLHHET